MSKREILTDWVYQALKANGGQGTLRNVAEHIWKHHEADLRAAGDLFYTWQYDMRWAATKLREAGKLAGATTTPKGVWAIKS